MTAASNAGSTISRAGVKTYDWYAWNNLMPPRPDDFHIVGMVDLPNPGVVAELVERVPQGINPSILLLNLILFQRPGMWIQVVTPRQVKFDKYNATYRDVQVFCDDKVIASVPVQDIH